MRKIVKRLRFIHIVDVVILLVTVGAVSYGLIQKFSRDDTTCQVAGLDHELSLKNGAFTETKVHARRCDTITVVNLDTQDYFINFGTHDKLVDYPGFEPVLLAPTESLTINAIASGTYRLHDHLRNRADADLVITPFK